MNDQYELMERNWGLYEEFKAENPLPDGCTCSHQMVNGSTEAVRFETNQNPTCPVHSS